VAGVSRLGFCLPFDAAAALANGAKFRTLKDLSELMQLHPRQVKRWWLRLDVPPTIAGHASHRWSAADAQLLLDRWAEHWEKRRKQP